jgi:hypothetical protein
MARFDSMCLRSVRAETEVGFERVVVAGGRRAPAVAVAVDVAKRGDHDRDDEQEAEEDE